MSRDRESFRFTRRHYGYFVLSGASAAAVLCQVGCSGGFEGAHPPAMTDAGAPEALVVEASLPEARPTVVDAGSKRADAGHRDSGSQPEPEAGAAPCDGSATPHDNPCVISETYGVFVAPLASGGSDATGTGTREKPYATLGAATSNAAITSRRVYACGASYPEQLVVGLAVDGISFYGGLECPTAGADGGVADSGTVGGTSGPWSYAGAAATIAPTATGYALDVASLVTGAHFEDMAFVAQPGTAASASSIAVLVTASAGVSFVRVAATSGAGVDGAVGAAQPSNACTGPMTGAIATGTSSGGPEGACTCPVTGKTMGGQGGGAWVQALPAANGLSTPTTTSLVSSFDGKGGKGWFVSFGLPVPASSGDDGANGSPNAGGEGSGQGYLLATGWSPVTGGNGGGGGGGGGASIAIAIVNSAVTLDAVALQTARGGNGGAGAPGEAGQAGGSGGPATGVGSANTGAGGNGGQGAGGSGGGGGAGGPSVGIAWTGSTAPVMDGAPTFASSTLGAPSSFLGAAAASAGVGGEAGAAAPLGAVNRGSPGQPGASGVPGSAGAIVRF